MEDQKPALGRFTWKVMNFSKLTDQKYYSDIFAVDGCKWQILIYPKGSSEGFFSIYLKVADHETLPIGWSREVSFSLTIINQNCGAHSTKHGGQCNFNQQTSCLGFSSFKHLNELHDLTKGFLVNDTLVVEAEVIVNKATPPVGFHLSLPQRSPQHAAVQANEFESYLTGLEDFIKSTTKTGGSSSDCRTPSSEEVEKAKNLLKECLSDFFELSIKDKLLAALVTLSSAKSGLSSEQKRSIQTFWANFDDFFSDYLTCEEDEFRFELHRFGTEQMLCAMKRNRETHVLYKKLLDNLSKNEEELDRKLQEVKSKKRKLMSDWKVLMTESEEAKLRYTTHEKKLEEAEERRRRAEERRARLNAVWSNLKAQFT
ncbi:hypothetical protein CRG98_036727 [Punica granatum]|uniref:MATH domain-containing protein n=1 Tax=Punica granatum TaxID=22663 RepID=A0A2I0IG16_PUNGR|nr:hypothetical protein CRG98_036727 [Punica granatum]